MVRIVSLLLSFALAFSQAAPAADRTLVAEGDYIAQKKDGNKPLAHWKLWHLSNGEYEVLESFANNAPLMQAFHFDAQFLPIGYSFKMGPISKAEAALRPNAAAYHPMSISCHYKVRELCCDTDYKGRKSTASIPAKQPYVFVPGEFYFLDFTWFLTGVVHLTERSGAKENGVNVYVMTDNETKRDEIALKPDSPIKLVFAGEETAQVMGKTQVVRKYERWGPAELSVLRVTSQGLVASLSGKSSPTIGFGMSNYKEYEPWGPTR